MWAGDVPAASVPTGEFTGAKTYVEKWSLPAPARWLGENTQQPQGDLLSALGRSSAPAPPKASDEMDDAQLLAAITGRQ